MDQIKPPTSNEGNPGIKPEEILGEWLVDCRHAMLAVGLRLLGDEELANEMVQRACLVALRRILDEPGLVEEVEKPCPWLVGITRNVVRGWFRDQARRARILEENALEIGGILFPSDDGECRFDRHFSLVFDVAPDVLTPKQWAVVRAALDGKKDHEIAVALTMGPATVRSHRSSAVRRLQAVFNRGV